MRRSLPILVVLLVQLVCAAFFLSNILSSVIGFAPFAWQVYELIELGAALGLIIGVILGALILRRTLARNSHIESQLRAARGAFSELMEERFTDWGLTPAERDVALFAIKGMSTQEMAALRGVSEGTIKAQTNAIYRKAGVSGRNQLLSLFIDDLIAEPAAKPPRLSA